MHPEILSICLFWFVTAYTPGPNNVVASYSGFNFGIIKTIPHIMGVTLGFGTAMLGEKAAMLCTASVEEVIDGHYKDQTYKLGKDEEELKKKIMKFRQDELDHKDIAYDNGATKKGLFGVLDKVIKTSSRIAITISEKI